MFIFHKDTTLEDLGNGVTRRILAHDGKMMAVEVNLPPAPSARCITILTNSSPMCSRASSSSLSARRRASSALAIRCISSRGSCTAASVCSPARCSTPLPRSAKIFSHADEKRGRSPPPIQVSQHALKRCRPNHYHGNNISRSVQTDCSLFSSSLRSLKCLPPHLFETSFRL